MRSLLSLTDLTAEELVGVVDRALKLTEQPPARSLAGRAVGIYFRRSSTRTKTSFWRASTLLGADTIVYGPGELQLTTGETAADTGRVLACYLDLLVARTNDSMAELRELDGAEGMGVVNALTEHEHPTQALADLVTLQEEFGDLAGRHVLYVGDGNSTARAFVHATALTPDLLLTVVTPPGYGLPDEVRAQAAVLGAGDRIRYTHDLPSPDLPVDVVYTTRWMTMGTGKDGSDWLADFRPYQVNASLMRRVGDEHTVFLHDLPAMRGQEVTDEVLDGPRSLAWRQARHKMTSAMAVLEWCAELI